MSEEMREEDAQHSQRVETALRGAGMKTREAGGLVVVSEKLTPEMSKQRRVDNATMAQSRAVHRKRNKHGQKISDRKGGKPWLAEAKSKRKQKRLSEKSQSS